MASIDLGANTGNSGSSGGGGGGGGGSGTVTQVNSGTGLTGGPITTIGTLSVASVSLVNQVVGNLPVTNLATGSAASSATFWRGDGTWATPAMGSGSSTGTVTQINTGAGLFGGPITTTGTLSVSSISLINQVTDILPIANGGTGSATAASALISLGAANNLLSNLSTTASTSVSANLIANTPGTFIVASVDPASSTVSKTTVLKSGNTDSANSGNGILQSGNVTTSGNSGTTIVQSGNNSGTGNSGLLLLTSGANSGSGATGGLTLATGSSTATNSGDINIGTGPAPTITGKVQITTGNSISSASSGFVKIQTGNNTSTGQSGLFTLVSGNTVGGNSGDIQLTSGNVTGSANSGNIVLTTGTSAGGTRSFIRFVDGTQGTSGYLWTAQDTQGNGKWSALGSISLVNQVVGNLPLSQTSGSISLSNQVVANGALNMLSHQINNVTDPTNPQDASTKNYVDTVASSLQPIQAVFSASTGNYPGVLVGNVLTITATGVLAMDGQSPPANSRVLLKDQTTQAQNGVYVVTGVGSVGVSPILTRAADYNTAASVNAGDLIPVINGTVNAVTSWLQTATVVTINTDPLVFAKWSSNPSSYLTYTANQYGVLLSGSGNIVSVLSPDASTLKVLVSGGTGANPIWALASTVLGSVSLSSQVVGNLPVTNLATGSAASSATFWRGDGVWATPVSSGSATGTVTQINTGTGLFGGPITTTGTLSVSSISLINQVVGNLPLSQTSGSISLTTQVSGILPVANQAPAPINSGSGGTTGSLSLTSQVVGNLPFSQTSGSISLTLQVSGVLPAANSSGLNLLSGSVSLTAQVSGNLPTARLNSGTGATSATFWRGDATWATPASGGLGVNGIFIINEQQPSGTQSGTFTSGSWQTRVLNNISYNTISSGASISSNQFTLPAGTYVISANAPAYAVDRHQAKLYNITNATDSIIGAGLWCASATQMENGSLIYGSFTIGSSNVFEIRHQCTTTSAAQGFGVECNFSVVNIFTQVQLYKQ